MPAALLAEVVRSGFVEGGHRGSLVALAADGSRLLERGEPDAPVFPRSSNKPLQAVALLELGLDLDGERRVLASAGLDETDLQTPPDLPVDEVEKLAYVAAGGTASPLVMNC